MGYPLHAFSSRSSQFTMRARWEPKQRCGTREYPVPVAPVHTDIVGGEIIDVVAVDGPKHSRPCSRLQPTLRRSRCRWSPWAPIGAGGSKRDLLEKHVDLWDRRAQRRRSRSCVRV